MPSHLAKTSIVIRAPVANVVAFLHDPVKLIRLNPLVTEFTQSPTDPNTYIVTDKMSVLGVIPITATAHSRFSPTDDGVDVEVQASSGFSTIKMTTRWRAIAQGDESCEMVETVETLDASLLTKHFVLYTLRKSHRQAFEVMKKKLEGHNETSSITNNLKLHWGYKVLVVMTVLVLYSSFYAGYSFKRTSIAIVSLLSIINYTSRKLCIKDPYGTFHVAFNALPGTDLTTPSITEWLNMGYWKETRIFPRACEALALKLVHAGKCAPGGRVLDVGHACGDSILLQLSHPDVPRPASVTGITSLPSHHKRSLERITKQQSSNPQACDVVLFCGDAIFRSENDNHPLNPASFTPSFTTIIALDCAYHFASRELFLRQSFARLSPGGTIALADLAVHTPLPFGLRTALSKMLSVRSENMITPGMYEAQLRKIGYSNIHITDISDDVFPGFRRFLKSRGGLWSIFELVIGWWVKAGGLFLIVSASRPEAFTGSEIRSY